MNIVPKRLAGSIPALAGGSEKLGPTADSGIAALLSLVNRQKLPILLVSALFVGGAVAALTQVSERYTARALVMIDPREQQLVGTVDVRQDFTNLALVDSQVQVLGSSTIARRVVERLALTDNQEFLRPGVVGRVLRRIAGPAEPPNADTVERQVLERLIRRTKIYRSGISLILAIEVQSSQPEFAAVLANTYAQEYIDDQVASKLATLDRAESSLASRVSALAQDVETAERALDQFVLKEAAESGDTASPLTQLDALRATVQQLDASRSANDEELTALQALIAQGDYRKLLEQLQSTPGGGELADLETELERLQSVSAGSAAGRRREIEEEIRNRTTTRIALLRQELEASRKQEQDARQQILERLETADPMSELSVALYKLRENIDTSRGLYESYLSRLKDLQQQRGLVLPDARLVATAITPLRASYPPWAPIVLGAAFAGLALGMMLGWLRDTFFRGFFSVQEVESATGVPSIAALPRAKQGGLNNAPPPQDSMVLAPFSPYAEGIRRLRTSIDLFGGYKAEGRGGRVVFITSSQPREGKSVTAVALGRAVAQTDQSAIVIDCDLRRASIHEAIKLEEPNDLVDILSRDPGALDLRAPKFRETRTPLAAILNSGSGEINSDRLFKSRQFAELLENCRRSFDMVILDGPPLGLVSDALLLATHADVTIFLIEWRRSRQRSVLANLDELRRVDCGDLFTVLNGTPAQAGYYGTFSYGPK